MKLSPSPRLTRPSRSLGAKVLARLPQPVAKKAGAGVAAPLLLVALPAGAAEADAVDQTVDTLVGAIKAAGDAAETALDVASKGVQAVQQAYAAAEPALKAGIEAATPIVQEAVRAAVPLVKQASPVVAQAVKDAVKSTGLDVDGVAKSVDGVVSSVGQEVGVVKPYVAQAVAFFTSTQPLLLAEYGLGAAAVVFLTPRLLGGLVSGLRGFAGELSPVFALDAVNSDGNTFLVDVRTAREKESSGLPDVASSAGSRLLEVEYAFTEDRKLRSALKDASGVETAVTALQIASLKRVNKKSKIVLLCRYGGTARAVAKELARRGFNNVYTVQGGFDGRSGWVASKLQIKPTATMYAPGGTGTSKFGSMSSKKSLPAPKSA